jgi:dihydroflavonol-4-reductase
MLRKILVSGATGFIAGHVIEQLLAKGHAVVGTVRDPRDEAKVRHLHAMPGAAERLTLVAADLMAPDPFSDHLDVDAVIHMASPYVMNVKDPQRDLVDPAVKGTVSMLRAAAARPRVKRVVLTSSMAAITDEPDGRVLTEADWNDKSSLVRNPYYYSKTMAERAAWDFMKAEKRSFDLVAINPFLVIGPSHTRAINTSNQIFVDILSGKYPFIMALNWGFVDVRDASIAHVLALNGPDSVRYICAAGNLDMQEVVDLIKQKGYPDARLPRISMKGSLGTALMKLASYAQPTGVGSYLRSHLGRIPRFDNSKIKNDLGMHFIAPSQSVSDTLADLARWGHIPAAQS